MELEEIKSKNLPVVETYEEFGEKLNEIDYSQEDFAALVTDLTSVLYADSLETIWGFIGFQWDEYNNYGHFNARSFEVGYIPQIPDPERIKKFPSNFISQMNDKEITIGYNEFTNLTEIDYILQDNNKDVNIYVDGINCKINLGQFGDEMDSLHFYQKIHVIGTQLKPFRIDGNIPSFYSEQTTIYIVIDEQTQFKFPIYGDDDHLTRCAYFWKGEGDFNFYNCFYNVNVAKYNNIFISNNNKFVINPIGTYSPFILHYKPDENYLCDSDINKIDSWQHPIEVTINWEQLEGDITNLHLGIASNVRLKTLNFINWDKLSKEKPVTIDSFCFICFLELYENTQSFVDFPWQQLIDLYDQGILTGGSSYNIFTNFVKSLNYKDTTEQVEITIHSDFFTINNNLCSINKRTNAREGKIFYYPFIINNPDNKNINIYSYVSIRDESMNQNSIDKFALNFSINANNLVLSYIDIFYNDTITYTFNNCEIGNNAASLYFQNFDKNDYIFLCNLNVEKQSLINVQYSSANENFDITEYFIEYRKHYEYLKIIKIEDNVQQYNLNNSVVLGPFTNNTSGQNLFGNKSNTLKNNDGSYFLVGKNSGSPSCKFIIFDIENWKVFYNADIQFICVQSNINDWYNSILDEQTTRDAQLSIVHENYIQLTSEQINHLIELGYTVIDYII